MPKRNIEQRVREILSKKLDVKLEDIHANTRLAEDLGVDSFGAVELMFEIEEAFELKIPDSDIEHVRTVSDIVAYVQEWLEKHAKAKT